MMSTTFEDTFSDEIRDKIYKFVGAEVFVLRCVNKFFAIELKEHTSIHTWSCTPCMLWLFMEPSVKEEHSGDYLGTTETASRKHEKMLYHLVTRNGPHTTLKALLYGSWDTPTALPTLLKLCTLFFRAHAVNNLEVKQILHDAIKHKAEPMFYMLWRDTSYEKAQLCTKQIKFVSYIRYSIRKWQLEPVY